MSYVHSQVVRYAVSGGALYLALVCAMTATAQLPAFDFRGPDPALTVAPTEVLTLGSVHLSQYRDSLSAADLDALRAKLAAYRPDAVTIESVPGLVCEQLLRYPKAYDNSGDKYCYDVMPFREKSGIGMDSALALVRTRLAEWPTAPSPSERRALAAAMLAANDRYSAVVQWLRLPTTERTEGNGLGPASVAYLDKLSASINENVQLGARLAADLGLERVYAVDDHAADRVLAAADDDFWAYLSEEIWQAPLDSATGALRARVMDTLSRITEPARVLEVYRTLNGPVVPRLFADVDFRRAMNDAGDEGVGRRYLAWWQTRNLAMVANVTAAAADVPGGRLLNIVGASHKLYYDAYLSQMHDLRVGDVLAVLE